MKSLIKYTTTLLLMVLITRSIYAQRYDNFYFASDADIIQAQGNNRIEHTLKGATIILPNGSDQLTMTINIPYEAFDNRPVDYGEFSSPGFLFKFKVNIDLVQIQEVLTSTKTFFTQGFLTLNNITKPLKVTYMPVVSRTNENGNFNIYMSFEFNSADFNLLNDSHSQFVLKINNGKVNRI